MHQPQLEFDINYEEENWLNIFPDIEAITGKIFAEVSAATMLKDYQGLIELSIVLTNDTDIRTLNKQYRGFDKPTNVLSFPNYNFDPGQPLSVATYDNFLVLGDIVMSLDSVLNEAKEQNKIPEHHLYHLMIHGMLHLLGFDHVQENEAEQMEQLEITILKKFAIHSPYIG